MSVLQPAAAEVCRMSDLNLAAYQQALDKFSAVRKAGRLLKLSPTIEVQDEAYWRSCLLYLPAAELVLTEAVRDACFIDAAGQCTGYPSRCEVISTGQAFTVNVSPALLGQVVDGLAGLPGNGFINGGTAIRWIMTCPAPHGGD